MVKLHLRKNIGAFGIVIMLLLIIFISVLIPAEITTATPTSKTYHKSVTCIAHGPLLKWRVFWVKASGYFTFTLINNQWICMNITDDSSYGLFPLHSFLGYYSRAGLDYGIFLGNTTGHLFIKGWFSGLLSKSYAWVDMYVDSDGNVQSKTDYKVKL